MFVFGAHIDAPDVFDKHCLPGIAAHGGQDATLITTGDLPRAKAYLDILEAATNMDTVDAIVLLREHVTITDPMFAVKVTRALAETPGLDLFHPVSVDGEAIEDCLILRPDVPTRLGLVPSSDSTDDPFTDDTFVAFRTMLLGRAEGHGLHAGAVPMGVRYAHPAPTGVGRVPLLADAPPLQAEEATVDQFRSAAAAWQGRAAHRITRAVLERWQHHPDGDRPTVGTHETEQPTRAPLVDLPIADTLTFQREELLTHVFDGARRVLDIACGTGTRGAAVRESHGAYVVGIEAGQQLADAARVHLDEVWHIDLNTVDLATLGADSEPFDVILMPDTLDRLLHPEAVLSRLSELLTDGGVLVVTVPNVKHWSVVLPLLLQDRFEYSPSGPIRPSSLRFFTMIEAAALLRRSGYAWCEVSAATSVPLESREQLEPLLTALAAYGTDVEEAQTLFEAYEFVMTARTTAPTTGRPQYGGDPAGE